MKKRQHPHKQGQAGKKEIVGLVGGSDFSRCVSRLGFFFIPQFDFPGCV